MFYGDRSYCIAQAHSRAREALGRAARSAGRDDQAKDEDSDAPEHRDTSSAGRSVSAVRYRRLRRET
jgi:hypothetical protein